MCVDREGNFVGRPYGSELSRYRLLEKIQSGHLSIVVRGLFSSHALNRIRCILTHARVPFVHAPPERQHHESRLSAASRDSPMLEIAGRPVQRLDVVMADLIPALGYSFHPAWESLIANNLDLGVRLHCSVFDWYRLATRTFAIRPPVGPAECLLLRRQQIRYASRHRKRLGLDGRALNTTFIARRFRLAMRGAFFHGDSPGHVDLSFYGTIAGLLFAGCSAGRELVSESGLEKWTARMDAAIPLRELFPASRPNGF